MAKLTPERKEGDRQRKVGSRDGRHCLSPWLTFSDRQIRDEWEDDGYHYRHTTFSCQDSILQSSTHMLLPYWNPTKHTTSSWNFFPERHCALSPYGSIRMFVSISVTSLPSSCPHFSLTGADTLRR